MELINVSGEPREYAENGFIYEFPFPTEKATKVPEEVGNKLLKTGYFKKPDVIKKEKTMEAE